MCFGEQLNLLRVKQIHRKLRFSSFPMLMNRLDNSETMSQILFHQRSEQTFLYLDENDLI